jgi:Winged helix DNA-binding domain
MGHGMGAQGPAVAYGPVTQLAAACAVADGLARQHLRNDVPATDVVQAARDLVGLHATGAPNPYLQLFTRMPGFMRPALDQELYERRSLARVRCMRGTLFLLPRDLLPIAWAATRELVLGPSTKYLMAQGLTPRSYERWASLVDAVLAGRALSAAQLRTELGAGRDVAVPAVLNQMCDEGRLLRDRPVAGWRAAHSTYCRLTEALPHVRLNDLDPAHAAALLIERYVARYGPVTLDDIAWWTGLGIRRCRDALHELGTQVTPVRVPEWDGEHWVIRADLDRIMHATGPEQTPVSLLAALDPYTMGFRRRARLLNPDRQDFVYDRGGNATSVVLVDGRIAGVWDVLTPGTGVGFFAFHTLTSPVEDQIKVELARIGLFITGTTVEVRQVGQMTPLTERRAGWVLKPLHDQ